MAASPTSARLGGSSDDGESATSRRGFSKRGDGFSVQETDGLLHVVRAHWQEGWDVIADVHNAQFPGHKRTAGSLKRKFAKLYRTKISASTKEKHARAASMAKKVREEMRGQRRGLGAGRGAGQSEEDLLKDTIESSMERVSEEELGEGLGDVAMGTAVARPPSQPLPEAAVTASEQELQQTLSQSVQLPQQHPQQHHSMLGQETLLRDDAWQSLGRWPIAGERLRTLRTQIESNEATSSQDLVQTVLLVLLESQRHRDLEREQEREERRQEKLQWQQEIREQRRRYEQERVEDRRRNDQFMQVMTTLVAQVAAGQQQRSGLN
uniref:Myb-like domain-containing protein n=1 Tax=Peronospora matthiolae TaxID=2874970 RepID=A0AAV1V2U6_9STRA